MKKMPDPRRLLLLSLMFVAVSAAAQPLELPPGVTMAMIARGDTLFHTRGMCVNCHGADATGVIGPNLTDHEWLQAKGSYLSILQTILTGVPLAQSSRGVAMPPRGGASLSDEDARGGAAEDTNGQQMKAIAGALASEADIANVAAYLASLEPVAHESRLGGDAAKGKTLYATTCIACHGTTAEGNFLRRIGRNGDVPDTFARPKGVAVDSEGHVYVADAAFNNIQIFDADGRLLMPFGSIGSEPGQLWMPLGLAIDAKDRIFVADRYNNRLQYFQYFPAPDETPLAGQ